MGRKLDIRVARKDGSAVAAMLTLRHGSSVIYKYGCSNDGVHNSGGIPFLFWKLIEESKMSGANKIDLGRTDCDQEGLIAFKDRLGATRRTLTYYRYTSITVIPAPWWRKRRPSRWGRASDKSSPFCPMSFSLQQEGCCTDTWASAA